LTQDVDLKPHQIVLILHIAAEYVPRQGAGLAVVFHAEFLAPGVRGDTHIAAGVRPTSYKQKELEQKRVKSEEGAQLYAVVFALGVALERTKKIRSRKEQSGLRKIILSSDSQSGVELIKHYLQQGRKSLGLVQDEDTRGILANVLKGIYKLQCHTMQVEIELSDPMDKNRLAAVESASTYCRRAGGKQEKHVVETLGKMGLN